MRSRTSSLRSWGQRTLNLSSDWVRFRARSMSPTSTPPSEAVPQNTRKPAGGFPFNLQYRVRVLTLAQN